MNRAQLLARAAYLRALMTAIHTRNTDTDLTGDDATAFDAAAAELVTVEGDLAALPPEVSDPLVADTPEAAAERAAARLADERRAAEADEQARLARIAAMRAQFAPTLISRVNPFDGDPTRMSRADLVSRGRRVVADDASTAHMSPEQRSALEILLSTKTKDTDGAVIARRLLATERPEYRSAFVKMMSFDPSITAEEGRALREVSEVRAMSGGVDASGGYGVPVLIDPTIILTAQGTPTSVLDLARVEVVTTDAWRGVSSDGVTWKFRAEAASTTDGAPTLAQPIVNLHTADGTIPYSFEIGADYPGFAAELSSLLTFGWRELLSQKLILGAGDGSDEPWGVVTRLTSVGAISTIVTTAATITAANVNAVWAKLRVAARMAPTTAWIANTNVENAIQALGVDAGSGFTANLTADGLPALKGRRFLTNDYSPALPAGTSNDVLAILGNWRSYVVAQKGGLSVEAVQNTFDVTTGLPKRQRALLAWGRVGGDVIANNDFATLKNKPT